MRSFDEIDCARIGWKARRDCPPPDLMDVGSSRGWRTVTAFLRMCMQLVLVLLFLILSLGNSLGEVTIATQGKDHGLSREAEPIVRCAMNLMETPFSVLETPWLRAQNGTRDGMFEGFFIATENQVRNEYAVLSAPIASVEWVFIAKKAAGIRIEDGTVQSLTVACEKGSARHHWLERLNRKNRFKEIIVAETTGQMMRMLLNDRADLLAMNRHGFDRLVTARSLNPSLFSIQVIRRLPAGIYFSKAFLKKNPGFMADFNAALEKCRSVEKEKITWFNVHWPPLQILRGEFKGQGRYDRLLQLIQRQMPGYVHEPLEMTWTRFWKDVKTGKHVLNFLSIKTGEREKYALFSKKMILSLPHRIILRRSTFDALGRPGSMSLSDFIHDRRLTGILEKSRSYSVPLDEILKNAGENVNFSYETLKSEQIFKMIQAKRVDYTIEYPFAAGFHERNIPSPSGEPFASIPIDELPPYIIAYIAGPINEWGERIMTDVNRAIDQIIPSKAYQEMLTMWHSNPAEIEMINRFYSTVLLRGNNESF